MEESIYEMVEENNKMLKKLVRRGMWSNVFRAIRYGIILILIIGSWYYTKPYVDQAKNLYIKVNETTDNISEMKDKADSALDFSKISELFNN